MLFRSGKVGQQRYPPRMTAHTRDEAMKFEQYRAQFAFLRENNISTQDDMTAFQSRTEKTMASLTKQRTILNVRKKKRRPLYDALASYAWRFWQPMLSLSNLYNTFINAVAYLERIFEMMDEPITVDDAPGATELPPITGGVEFRNVVFSYDGSVNVLENFNLNITPGEIGRASCRERV